jgi:hypothetical protein
MKESCRTCFGISFHNQEILKQVQDDIKLIFVKVLWEYI